MKERPILFSPPMVLALLAGSKTQTRRAVKSIGNDGGFVLLDHGNGWCPYRSDDGESSFHTVKRGGNLYLDETPHACPYGMPGDRLWVRESWQYYDWNEEGEPCIRFCADNATTWPEPRSDEWRDKLVDVWETLSRDENYRIDNRARDRRWRPSIHMPRWASRITLEVVSVRVERLNDISEADCVAEGCSGGHGSIPGYNYAATPFEHYLEVWEKINGAGSWAANPWVWVVEFRRIKT